MRFPFRRILAGAASLACLGLLLAFSPGCDDDKTPLPEGLPAAAEAAARLLLAQTAVDPQAEVYLMGPVAGGSRLREKQPDTSRVPVELAVPDTLAGAYLVFLNDHPDMMYAHEVRYAWVHAASGASALVTAHHEPLLLEPGVAPRHFDEIAVAPIEGVTIRYGTGGGLRAVSQVMPKPSPLSLAAAASLAPPAPGARGACQKQALVLDCGVDDNGYKRDGTAGALADNAALAASFLEDNGFSVDRISQAPGNNLPGLVPDNDANYTMETKLRRKIESYAQEMDCPCDGDPPCHEFFLYICAHGNKGVFEFNRFDDSGGTVIHYSSVNEWLRAFPACVKVILFIDSCHAGSAIPDFSEQCNLRGDCGFTIFTTCSADDTTPVGSGITDSGTQDWAEGTDDLDEDGKAGDLGDRWKSLEDENSDYGPQRSMCEGQTSMCSTD